MCRRNDTTTVMQLICVTYILPEIIAFVRGKCRVCFACVAQETLILKPTSRGGFTESDNFNSFVIAFKI